MTLPALAPSRTCHVIGRAPPLDMPLLATPPDESLTPGLLSGRTAHLSKSLAAFAFLASVPPAHR